MTPEAFEIEKRIQAGEDVRTEFKDERAHPDALATAIVSFANVPKGGDLLIGVGNDKTITGVTDPDSLILKLTDICRNNIEPPLKTPDIEKYRLGDKIVLVATVSKGPQRPYRTNKGIYHIREGASRRVATRQELFELYQSAGLLHPDEMPIENASIEDLDLAYLGKIRPYLSGLPPEDVRQILVNTRILKEGWPTLAGVVCFGRNVAQFCPYARITAIRVLGKAVGDDFTDRREITGVIEQQIKKAQEFVREQVEAAGRTKVIPIYPFPFEAVDEAIVNAIAHRDYHVPAQVRLFIFNDRIEVISPGRLLNSVTVEQMRHGGCHVVRNALVFSHLSSLQLAIDSGWGIPRMISLMRARGLPEPQIVSTDLDLRVTFFL